MRLEVLEQRRLLTTFGEAWPNERELTISFPADGVAIGHGENEIASLLDPVADRQQWQELLLRAYQTWSIHSGFNVGLRNDFDVRFGTPGLTVGDPRFGEFRIGAFPQTGLVASSVPFQAIAGTNSGDLLLNSNETFTFHDWQDSLPPDPATIEDGDRDVFSLFLHESGNTLGIDDNDMSWSVMFGQYTVPKGVLAEEDIAAIQALYGQRIDPYELVDNGEMQVATLLGTPADFEPNTQVLRARGSLKDGQDVDVFKVVPVSGFDEITFRVRAKGVSLVQSKLEVLDSAGNVLQSHAATSVFDNDNELTLSGMTGTNELYLRVSPLNPDDIYAVGDYYVEVDYRDAQTRASDLLPGDYNSGADALFTGFDLADLEVGQNETVGDAVSIDPTDLIAGNRYELQAAIGSSSDIDFYKITAPADVDGKLVVHLSTVGTDAPLLKLRVVDSTGQPVGTAGRMRADGTISVEVASPQASEDYFVRIGVDPSSSVDVGNYVVVAQFDNAASTMHQLSSGTVDADADRFIRWEAAKTKLFRFDLSAVGLDQAQAVRMTIYDAHTREVKLVAKANADVTRTVMAWLQEGEYILQFSAIADGEATATGIDYSLAIDGLSDDQDDSEYDGENTGYDPYDYEYRDSYDYSDVYAYGPSYYTYYYYYYNPDYYT
ncbi:matrixin family metalloprotease [Stieleria sp. JC731]|uniref:matrixin family metalloprotease n=1 Tax=Stieleria sp. JC731 TaxID=2894195 RepID=UPI001E540444|nr:matrixin family metalloprotease [Stieleria sp. JC731]MCC9600167.1 matrixin family metalloprotease [Stieleria sp. JC731]